MILQDGNDKFKNIDKSESVDDSLGTMEDVQAIMQKYDRESNTRHFEGIPRKLVRWYFALFSLYCIYMNMISLWDERVRRVSFVGLLVMMAFAYYPVSKSAKYKLVNYLPWYDVMLGLLGGYSYLHHIINLHRIMSSARPSALTTLDVFFAVVGILLMFEACRRVSGIPIVIVASAFIVYAFFAGTSISKLTYQLFYTTEGVIGVPISVCASFIVLFILFGAIQEMTGVSDFFIRAANSIVGGAIGGPAKVAVVASALLGMVSGSSVANTVGSGSVTIPMMKRMGYRGEFAGAVEAAASTGGQIMPPIMGAAAFLMAEMVGVPYSTIAYTAIVPAVLYFSGVFMMVHLEAKKCKLRGLSKDEIPNFWKLFRSEGYLVIPLIFLVFTLATNWRTAATCAMYASLVALIVSTIRNIIPWFGGKSAEQTPSERSAVRRADCRRMGVDFITALENGGRNTISVGMACSAAGIIAGVVTMTGIGQILISNVLDLANGIPIIAMVITMFACIVLGMGVPTTANYIIMATTCAPILISLGIDKIASNMFVFYFGIVADITPPVALAAYAGAALAKANPIKTGLNATRLAIAAFIIPLYLRPEPGNVAYQLDAS